MRPRSDDSETYPFSDNEYTGGDQLSHKRQVRKKLEERLENRRLKRELEDYDEDYDWDDTEK